MATVASSSVFLKQTLIPDNASKALPPQVIRVPIPIALADGHLFPSSASPTSRSPSASRNVKSRPPYNRQMFAISSTAIIVIGTPKQISSKQPPEHPLASTARRIKRDANMASRKAESLMAEGIELVDVNKIRARMQALMDISDQLKSLAEQWEKAKEGAILESLDAQVQLVLRKGPALHAVIPQHINLLIGTYQRFLIDYIAETYADIIARLKCLDDQNEYLPLRKGLDNLVLVLQEFAYLEKEWTELNQLLPGIAGNALVTEYQKLKASLTPLESLKKHLIDYEEFLKNNFRGMHLAYHYKFTDESDIAFINKISNDKWVAFDDWLNQPTNHEIDEKFLKDLAHDFLEQLKEGRDLLNTDDQEAYEQDHRNLTLFLSHSKETTSKPHKPGFMEEVD